MNSFMSFIFMLTLRSSVLILLIMIMKLCFSKILSFKIIDFAWMLVFLSFLMPLSMPSKISIYNIPASIIKYVSSDKNIDGSFIAGNISSENNVDSTTLKPSDGNNLPSNSNNSYEDKHTSENLTLVSNYTILTLWLFMIWGTIALSLGLFFIISQIYFLNKLKDIPKVQSMTYVSIVSKCSKLLKINTKVKIKETTLVKTPSIVGILRPQILIPIGLLQSLDTAKLELIFLHELCHFKRKDTLKNNLILLLKTLCWFNPIIWWGLKHMKLDMEVCCDQDVLLYLKEDERISYANLIIDLVSLNSKPNFAQVNLNNIQNKSELKRRITMIKNYKKRPLLITSCSLCLVLFVGYSAVATPYSKKDAGVTTVTSISSKDDTLTHEFENSYLPTGYYYNYYNADTSRHIQLSLYNEKDGLKGTYADKNSYTTLTGEIEKNQINLFATNASGKKVLFFTGTILMEGDIQGYIVDLTSKKKQDVNLMLSSSINAPYGHKYENSGLLDDSKVEEFAKNIKLAVSSENKEDLASMVRYPISVNIDRERIIIDSKDEFLTNYDSIVTPEFKYSIENSFPLNMFSNYNGIMFGSGNHNVWINLLNYEDKNTLAIIAINN